MAKDYDWTHLGQRLHCLDHCALYKRTIKLTCPRCGGVRRFDAVTLWWMFHRKGWSDQLPQAGRRFYCQVCRRAGAITRPKLEITRERPDAEQPPYPDESTWKRLVSRYRS